MNNTTIIIRIHFAVTVFQQLYLYSTSGDDPLTLESFVDCTPPPKAGLRSKIEKQKATSMIFIYKLGLDVRMSKHKPLKEFNTS